MNVKLFVFYLLFLITIKNVVNAQYEFIENRGQWHDNIKYKVNLENGAMFLENNSISFHFINDELTKFDSTHYLSPHGYNSNSIRKGHAYKLSFLNSKIPYFSTDKIKLDYNNYFIGNQPEKWASNVRKYEKIIYNNLYDGIDLAYYNNLDRLKYDFIIHPGANIFDISIKYDGPDILYLEKENLIIKTSVNIVEEVKPFAYQIVNNDTVKVICNYSLVGNVLSFVLSNSYDKSKDLIIDPSLIFSTYSGSLADNWGFTATWDYSGNVYSGGIVFDIGYPTSVGAYQFNFAGGTAPIPGSPYYGFGCDIGIIKYNETGTQRLYATYLGGSGGQEMPHSLVVTEKNDLVIMGTTGSNDFPTTTNAFSRDFSGGTSITYDNVINFPNGVDIFVAKLKEDGTQLLGGTYIGGSNNDGLNFKQHYTQSNYVEQHGNDTLYFNYGDGARGEVIVDDLDMIYVGTNTFSNDFPSGIIQGYQTNNGGEQDGIAFKLSQDCSSLIWSSYLGGSGDDAIFSICLDNLGDVLVTGGTVSQNFPITQGAYNTNYNGGTVDAFISKISPNGSNLINSTYFGSNKYDNAYFVRTDNQNNVFICGQTKAIGSTLIHNAPYSIANSGQFITKFLPNLSNIEWSTVFGNGNGRPNISITAFAIDICNRVYLSGWGREWTNRPYNAQGDLFSWSSQFGTKGMEITDDAIQPDTDGQDFYVMVLGENASHLEYATFFGEIHYDACYSSGRDHVDGGTARFDSRGHIIQSGCGSCGGCQRFPTSPNPGAWSNTNRASNCNDIVFKIRVIENLTNANFTPIPIGCAPYNVQFTNNSQGVNHFWDFGDGTTSIEVNPYHTFVNSGEYEVRLVVSDPGSCNFSDTISRIIRVVEPITTSLQDLSICLGESIQIGPENNYNPNVSFSWSGGIGLSNVNIKNPIASPNSTTNYTLVISGICKDTIRQRVEVLNPEINVDISNNITICRGNSTTLSALSTSNILSWEWSDNSSFSNILSNTQSLTVSPNNTTTYYLRLTESLCRTSRVEQVVVTIHQFNYDLSPEIILCYGSTTNLTINNNNAFDNLSYLWTPLSQIISGENTNSPLVNPTSPITFYVSISNQIGCETTDSVYVNIDKLVFYTPNIANNLCFGQCGGIASVSAVGIPPYSFLWNNGHSSSVINGLCSGTYTVTVTDGNNCTAEMNINISSPPKILADFIDVIEPQCDRIGYGVATIDVSGGVPGYNYIWSNNGGNGITNTQCLVGINTVTVTDSNNCTSEFSIDLPSPSTLNSSIEDHNMVSCYGFCDGSVVINGIFGMPPYEYYWSNGVNEQAIYNLCPGEYMVTIIDTEDCVSHKYVSIIQPDSLIANVIILSPILCHGATGNLGVDVQGGMQEYIYNWSNNSNENTLNGVLVGTYHITVIDANGCKDYSTISISEPDEIIINSIAKNMICNNNCNGEIRTYVNGGVPPYSYLWSNGNINNEIYGICDGEYQLKVKDNNNCIFKSYFTIYNDGYVPDLSVDASSREIFEGESVRLIANSSHNGKYLWNHKDVLDNNEVSNPIATPLKETLFTVKFYDENRCENIDTVRIKVKEVICKDPYIFVPTAFTPNNDGKNDYFKPFFPNSLVTSIIFTVCDRWGNVIYESTNLYDNGWDGTFKGEKLSSDVYVFWLKARCLNGEEYNYKGNVTLLR